ncbi:hypothetical protein DPX16_11862 [Anabarilius grahami]|uniref:Uncharacterized protein n=1 Tax=Anabarilius grahami TaxID=495550 RepID=A0A3N0YD98_ANAGA|nr:hypothetical protein DPX16_11862 [Anabarilius grahami]
MSRGSAVNAVLTESVSYTDQKLFFTALGASAVNLSVLTMACSSHYGNAIEEFCLAKFKLDMEVLDQRQWCSWEDTVELKPLRSSATVEKSDSGCLGCRIGASKPNNMGAAILVCAAVRRVLSVRFTAGEFISFCIVVIYDKRVRLTAKARKHSLNLAGIAECSKSLMWDRTLRSTEIKIPYAGPYRSKDCMRTGSSCDHLESERETKGEQRKQSDCFSDGKGNTET